ncbi:MAG: hypothetical protein HQL55_17990 [Magnetococcales bacterium]|nr:hypothetical protein [Magnetococcales bacterium]
MAKTRSQKNQKGNAILVVMLAMVMLMAIAGALTEHMAASESQAIDESLAKIQIYWAMRGQLDFVVSRAGHDGATSAAPWNGNMDDTALANTMSGFLSTYFGSVAWTTSNSNSSVIQAISASPPTLRWNYPEYGTNYNFEIDTNNTNASKGYTPGFDTLSGGSPPDAGVIATDNDGRLYFLFSVTNPATNSLTTTPLLRNFYLNYPNMKADLCVGDVTIAMGVGSCDTVPATEDGFATLEKLNMVWRAP